jgi:hypothetical protein
MGRILSLLTTVLLLTGCGDGEHNLGVSTLQIQNPKISR